MDRPRRRRAPGRDRRRPPLCAGPVACERDRVDDGASLAGNAAKLPDPVLRGRRTVGASNRKTSRVGVDHSVFVKHGVLVGVVGRSDLNESPHQRGLAGEALTRNDECSAIERDDTGVHEDPIGRARRDQHPDVGVN